MLEILPITYWLAMIRLYQFPSKNKQYDKIFFEIKIGIIRERFAIIKAFCQVIEKILDQ
jgi:hypothetical protein